jgi:hypothetical protein
MTKDLLDWLKPDLINKHLDTKLPPVIHLPDQTIKEQLKTFTLGQEAIDKLLDNK